MSQGIYSSGLNILWNYVMSKFMIWQIDIFWKLHKKSLVSELKHWFYQQVIILFFVFQVCICLFIKHLGKQCPVSLYFVSGFTTDFIDKFLRKAATVGFKIFRGSATDSNAIPKIIVHIFFGRLFSEFVH